MFNFRHTLLGGCCLPLGWDRGFCTEVYQIASDIHEKAGSELLTFLADVTLTNFVLSIIHAIQYLGFSWIKPDIGKYALETDKGYSVVYITMASTWR